MLAVALLLTACASLKNEYPSSFDEVASSSAQPSRWSGLTEKPDTQRPRPSMDAKEFVSIIKRGDGVFIRPDSGVQPARSRQGTITLNFEKAALPEVVSFILGDLLKRNYVIDPRVQGSVTLHTSQPLVAEDLPPVLEALLHANSATLIESEGFYQVIPLGSAALSGPGVGVGQRLQAGSGYALQIVPLRYISAREMHRVLQPVAAKGATVEVLESRNLLTISAPRQTMIQLLEMVRMFDVDWMKGLSLGLYPLKHAAPATLISELQTIFGTQTEGAMKGMLTFEPIERLNAVLVLSKQPRYLDEASEFIQQLDRGDQGPARQLQVYPVRNGKAEYIAELLKQLFEAAPEQERSPVQARAAALRTTTPASPAPVGVPAPAGAPAQPTLRDTPAIEGVLLASESAVIGESQGPVSIIPDPVNNNLMVMASSRDHQTIQAALEQLEIRPRQVLIEATIAEISLTDNLSYGLQWFLERGFGGDTASLQFGDFTALGGGFVANFISGSGDVRVLFDALANESKLKILSSPQLMVIDNESGSIRVGDQIPIITRQTTSIDDPNAPIVSEVQFRDTGVLLQVVPHIHAGGLVRMEVNLEVSEPSADAFAAGNVSILQRSIDSSVVVQSGETVVLGGLILENKTQTETGVPGLYKLPGVGKLFSRTVDDDRRTELMITLRPKVIETLDDARAATEELRQRLRNLNRSADDSGQGEAREPTRIDDRASRSGDNVSG